LGAFLTALALVLVLEGLLLAVSPMRFRQALALFSRLDDASLRRFGVYAMLLGLVLTFLVKSFFG
jgi:uncharacterized protein